MATIAQRMRIVEAVMDGATFREAGRRVGLSGNRAGKNFVTACAELGIGSDVKALRTKPDEVRRRVREVLDMPANELPSHVVSRLTNGSPERLLRLSPERFARIPAARVLRLYGPRVLVEVEKWLAAHGVSMPVTEVSTLLELRQVQEAFAVLRAFGIHVEIKA